MDRGRALVNALTLGRLIAVALGFWAAFERDALATVTFGLAAVATDIADGALARRWAATSKLGANFDSVADFIFYASLLAWVYLFLPDAVERHATLYIVFFALYCIGLSAAFLLRGTIAVHDSVSRTTGTAGAFAGLWFIAFGYHEWMLAAVALFATADLAHRLHSIVQAIAIRRTRPQGAQPVTVEAESAPAAPDEEPAAGLAPAPDDGGVDVPVEDADARGPTRGPADGS